jgi:hypothetical protein
LVKVAIALGYKLEIVPAPKKPVAARPNGHRKAASA